MLGNTTVALNSQMMRDFNSWKTRGILILSVLLVSCLTLFSPSKAEGHYEMFEEICEITGEVKQRFNYSSSFGELSVVDTMELEEN